MKNQDKRITALMRRILRRKASGLAGVDTPGMIRDHAKRHGVSVSTANRDFDAAIDKIWAKSRN